MADTVFWEVKSQLGDEFFGFLRVDENIASSRRNVAGCTVESGIVGGLNKGEDNTADSVKELTMLAVVTIYAPGRSYLVEFFSTA